ncbi:MAG: hypothetical protein K9J30_02075 [Bacteroidales bacterium]|nr:hypothetical protein [Bacteroidales bacterium]
MKKRILRSTAAFVFLAAFIMPSCEFLEECGTCELVTDDGNEITYGTPLIFCGDNLLEKQNSEPVSIGGVTTWWNCY